MKIRLLLGVAIVAYLTSALSVQADDHCSIPGVSFASCAEKGRYFQSVVIAIPGWRGTCRSTFGEGAGNLLNVMRRSSFFDTDCFDYDSHHTALADSRAKLRERIAVLQKAGYREFAFVTHSTGGILALDLLLTEAQGADGDLRDRANRSLLFKSDGTRLRALYTWAMPLNGVRDSITWLGKIINGIKWSPAVLPHLAADSEYLKQLRERLGGFDARYGAASGADRSDYEFTWVILQGQDDDGVVRNIVKNETWFPKSIKSAIVNTASGHSYNVAEGGEVGAPLYPGEMMSDKAKLALTLYPRINEYFAPTVIVTGDLGRQQRVVLGGVLDYAGNATLFEHSYLPVSNFITVLLKGRFPRDPGFDEEAVAGFTRLLDEKVRAQDHANAVDFADRLLNDIEHGLQLDAVGQSDRFGGGSALAVRRLPNMIDSVFRIAADLVRSNQELGHNLRSCQGSLKVFETRAARLLARFLKVADLETQSNALGGLQNVVRLADAGALADSQVVAELKDYSLRKYSNLGGTQKTILAQIFVTLAQRSEVLGSETFAALGEGVRITGGQTRPLWDSLFAKNEIDSLVTTLSTETVTSSAKLDFLGTVMASDGPQGNSPDSASRAIEAYSRLAAGRAAEARGRDAIVLERAARNSQYPAVTRDIQRTLRLLFR